jgi:hypothetical protein
MLDKLYKSLNSQYPIGVPPCQPSKNKFLIFCGSENLGPDRLVVVSQGKGRGDMHIPPQGVVRGHLKRRGWKEKWIDSISLATNETSQ